MSANTANSTDESSGSVAADFRIVVFSLPDDLERLAQALITLPHMDMMATARLQTHLLPGIMPHCYSHDTAVGVTAEIEGTYSGATL